MTRRPVQSAVKRVLDPVLAALLLILLSPIFLVVTLVVLIGSGRPIFFIRPRAGKDGKPFRMVKFRTMVPDAIALGQELNLSEDPFGLVENDPRMTRGGRFLRRTGLDEIPQLANVLTGRMSIVGPRPDMVEQAQHYTEEERRRLVVRPGITGWSQIHGREDMTWTERFRYDAWYLEHWSLWLDLKIVLRTFGQLFRSEPVPVQDALNIERAQGGREEPEA